MSSEVGAGRARETVRSHLKGAECEANLLQVNGHARKHTNTHTQSRVRVEQKHTKTDSMHDKSHAVYAVRDQLNSPLHSTAITFSVKSGSIRENSFL